MPAVAAAQQQQLQQRLQRQPRPPHGGIQPCVYPRWGPARQAGWWIGVRRRPGMLCWGVYGGRRRHSRAPPLPPPLPPCVPLAGTPLTSATMSTPSADKTSSVTRSASPPPASFWRRVLCLSCGRRWSAPAARGPQAGGAALRCAARHAHLGGGPRLSFPRPHRQRITKKSKKQRAVMAAARRHASAVAQPPRSSAAHHPRRPRHGSLSSRKSPSSPPPPPATRPSTHTPAPLAQKRTPRTQNSGAPRRSAPLPTTATR